MVTQSRLHDKDFVLWAQLAGELLGAEVLARIRASGHSDARVSHGFLVQQLVDGPRAVGDVAGALGVTSQAVSKLAGELERLGYLRRTADPADARVRRLELTARGQALRQAAASARTEIGAELREALGAERVDAAAATLVEAVRARGSLDAVLERRVRRA
jgi:DNA-binding MarR family transcriptional regulator